MYLSLSLSLSLYIYIYIHQYSATSTCSRCSRPETVTTTTIPPSQKRERTPGHPAGLQQEVAGVTFKCADGKRKFAAPQNAFSAAAFFLRVSTGVTSNSVNTKGTSPLVRERGSAPKRGRHSTIFVPPNAHLCSGSLMV